ncbi:DUF485 domain-containing protein [Peterkaempfera bronchialis]|uniref:DUF485 domain-containing protein n=1 Tax=Peterkaempfera bronchialis TaxID=2126346 RepID=A0A345T1B0_9ACTN|nr:DUF485 domain-containing protein [Peterkaempfera bronchialis]
MRHQETAEPAGPPAGSRDGFDWWAVPVPDPEERTARPAPAEVYRSVQQGEAFRRIRRGYRGFVFPVTALFLLWYLLYLVAATGAPGLMRRQVAGPLNLAWLLGLLQFASTFLITWLYGRSARAKRDRAALGLRWDTQDRLR